MFVKRKTGKIFCLMLILLVTVSMFGFPGEIQAEENNSEVNESTVDSHRDSIVRVESICWDGDSVIYQTKSFSGFVAVSDNSGVYIVTIHDDLSFSAEEKEAIESEYKEKLKAEEAVQNAASAENQNQYSTEPSVRIADKIEVILNGDVRVKASIVGESEQRNLTVLKLEQTINFENAFEFPQKNMENLDAGTKVWLLGYPRQEEPGVYNNENVQVTEGTISGKYDQEEISFFYHNIQTDEGCIGGPLLYSDGLLAGVYLTGAGENDGTAISSESLKSFLETFKISGKEHQEKPKEKKKLPLLNIILGVVILVLLIVNIAKGNARNTASTKISDSSKKDKKAKNTQNLKNVQHTKHTENGITGITANLDYPSENRTVLINKPRFLIGRTGEVDFVLLENKGISRKHACIEFEDQEFYLSDLNSTNHTFLNGNQLMPGKKYKLKSGDEIMIGKETMMFYRE